MNEVMTGRTDDCMGWEKVCAKMTYGSVAGNMQLVYAHTHRAVSLPS